MLTDDDEKLITDALLILYYNLHLPFFPSKVKTKVDRLEYLFKNTKGISKTVTKNLMDTTKNLYIAISKKDIEKALDAFDNLVTVAQLKLKIKIKRDYIRER